MCLDHEADYDDPIIFCDGSCGTCMHLSCYGLDSAVTQAETFFCEACSVGETVSSSLRSSSSQDVPHRKNTGGKFAQEVMSSMARRCVLCRRAGGLMKRSACNQWTHPLCVMFTPELTVDANMRANNLAAVDAYRQDLKCTFCRSRGAACVQCHYGDCCAAFHPYCAYEGRLQMIVREAKGPASIESSIHYEIYCRKHRDKALEGSGEVMSCRVPLRRPRKETARLCGTKRKDRVPRTSGPPRKKGGAHGGSDGIFSKHVNQQAYGCFELEAQCSGSEADHGDDGEGSDCTDDGDSDGDGDGDGLDLSNISGDFINDGSFTQHTESPGDVGMYLAVNRRQDELDSPQSLDEQGRVRVDYSKLVYRGGRSSSDQADTPSTQHNSGDKREVGIDTSWYDDGDRNEGWISNQRSNAPSFRAYTNSNTNTNSNTSTNTNTNTRQIVTTNAIKAAAERGKRRFTNKNNSDGRDDDDRGTRAPPQAIVPDKGEVLDYKRKRGVAPRPMKQPTIMNILDESDEENTW